MTKARFGFHLALMAVAFLVIFLLNMAAHASPYKVAVIDTGFAPVPFDNAGFKLCKSGHFNFNNGKEEVGVDRSAHGAFVTSIINQHAQTKNMCFLVYKLKMNASSYKDIRQAFLKAWKEGAQVINFSVEMYHHDSRLERIFKFLANKGIKIYAAAGNSATNLNRRCRTYPSCYAISHPNLVLVGALDADGDVAKYSNYGARIGVYKYGKNLMGSRGTSFAAPRAAGDYIKSLQLDK